MMHDKQSAAVARYRAMARLLRKLPPKAARRARADQKRHAARYVTRRRGRPVCDPLKMVRFLVDVCGLSLKEASGAVRTAIMEGGCGAWPGAKDSKGMAKRLYACGRGRVGDCRVIETLANHNHCEHAHH
jgi:hypothetical protein